MPGTAIQLWTLRELNESIPELVERVGETDFDAVELAGLDESTPAEVTAALDRADLTVSGAHVGIDALEDDVEATVETYRALDCDQLIVPYLGEEHFDSHEAVVSTADRLETLAVALDDRGCDLLYHNHAHELARIDGTPALETLVEATETVDIEFDIGWSLHGGVDPRSFVERHGERIPMLHVTDADEASGDHAEVGHGDVDVAGCIDAAKSFGVDWLVYEHDEPDDALASLDHGATALADYR